MKQRRRAGAILGCVLLFGTVSLTSCASAPDAVLETGGRNLHCGNNELEVVLNRETPVVREYAVACNFMYTRVHCTKTGCRSAPLEPPCVGNLPCFEEDPVSLEWRLKEPRDAVYMAR
jgi:hypothetical protein